MKKLIALIMLVIMSFTFSGCATLFLTSNREISKQNIETEIAKPETTQKAEAKEVEPPPSQEPEPTEEPKPAEEPKTVLTEEEAYELAVKYWDWEPYYDENGELVTSVSTTIASFGETIPGYYSFHLKWWVDDHWSTIDSVYVNKNTGECTYSID